jgi:hypothetical protein
MEEEETYYEEITKGSGIGWAKKSTVRKNEWVL